MSAPTSVKSVCPYCGVGCGIVMQVEGHRVIKVTGDKTHPTNFGRLCTKGNTCGQAIAESGRMEHAFLRHERSREPVQIAMDQAIRETARRLRSTLDAHGPDALALYVSGQMSLEAQYLANEGRGRRAESRGAAARRHEYGCRGRVRGQDDAGEALRARCLLSR